VSQKRHIIKFRLDDDAQRMMEEALVSHNEGKEIGITLSEFIRKCFFRGLAEVNRNKRRRKENPSTPTPKATDPESGIDMRDVDEFKRQMEEYRERQEREGDRPS